ncbi:MAG: acyl dehydratase [Pseudohongiellaceae bacterium]|jgi:acyl dehydratase
MTTISNQQILAMNDAEDSENRIHSDEIAAKYGFTGALVSGVNVFGYLTQPLVKAFGAAFLKQGMMDVIFLKPAYQDDLLTITTEESRSETSKRNCVTSLSNEKGKLLAKLESWLPAELPPINELAGVACEHKTIDRLEIEWDLILLQKPAPAFTWQPSYEENQEHITAQRDMASCYTGSAGHIHPYFLLDACNQALMRLFVLPAWIHTGSKITLRAPLLVGQPIEMKTVPIDKWERKNHQFIKLYIAMLVEGDVVAEIEHTAIFKIAS